MTMMGNAGCLEFCEWKCMDNKTKTLMKMGFIWHSFSRDKWNLDKFRERLLLGVLNEYCDQMLNNCRGIYCELIRMIVLSTPFNHPFSELLVTTWVSLMYRGHYWSGKRPFWHFSINKTKRHQRINFTFEEPTVFPCTNLLKLEKCLLPGSKSFKTKNIIKETVTKQHQRQWN